MKNDIGHYAKIEKLLEQMEEKESERYKENKDKIDECCKENKIKRIEDNKGLIEVYRKDWIKV